MSFHIKICGLTDPGHAVHAYNEGADMLGLVFFDKSPRHVTADVAAGIAGALRGRASLVGLFVNPSVETVTDILENVPLTHIQLHGAEDSATASRIAEASGLPVIKALGVSTAEDIARAEETWAGKTDMLLFDAKPPASADRPGGNGISFDRDILSGVTGATPWMLSGGLTPDNVFEAVDAVQWLPGFAGVDVSSGVEAAPGRKDKALISAFIENARAGHSDYMDKDA